MRHLIWLAIAAAAGIGLIGSCTVQDPLGGGDSNTPGDVGDSNGSGAVGDSDASGDVGDSDGSGGVDDSNASGDVGGTLNVVDFNVPAGQTTQVTSDVVVNASGDVLIEGTLATATVTTPGAKGFSITIVAEGDIEVTGTIQAGNGTAGTASTAKLASALQATEDQTDPPGGDGGGIELRAGGNLTIGTTASLIGGNGGGGSTGPWGGAGGVGGDVRLGAGATLTMQGSLTIGNGGDGGGASPTGPLSDDLLFGGRGGDSGVVFAKAGVVDWPSYDAATNSLDPLQTMVTGGLGGNGPPVLILTDVVLPSAKPIPDAEGIGAVVVGGACSGDCSFRVRDGGNGFFAGGLGGNIAVTITELWPGTYDGPVITVRAGHGGSLARKTDATYGESIAATFAHAGVGGAATAGAPRGRDGDLARWDGGYGGTAIAYGGDGGSGALNLLQYAGVGGAAYARAGAGGDGRDGCYTIGYGGAGGIAKAYGGRGGSAGFGASGGNASAYGGDGGKGGDGGESPCSGGKGGAAFAVFGRPGQYNAGFYTNPPIFGAVESRKQGTDGDAGVAGIYGPNDFDQGNNCPDAEPPYAEP